MTFTPLPTITDRAIKIAEQTVRPVVSPQTGNRQEQCVGLFVGEECRFLLPIRFVSGTDDCSKLLTDLRLVIQHAVERALKGGQ